MSAMLPEDVSLSVTRASTMPAVAGSFRSCGAATARPPRNSHPKWLINCSIRLEILRIQIGRVLLPGILPNLEFPVPDLLLDPQSSAFQMSEIARPCRLQIPTAAELPVHSLRGSV